MGVFLIRSTLGNLAAWSRYRALETNYSLILFILTVIIPSHILFFAMTFAAPKQSHKI
jgi:hypothetical protein